MHAGSLNRGMSGEDDEAYVYLANAIVMQAFQDLKKSLKRLKKKPFDGSAMYVKKDCERFFRSEWFKILCSVSGEKIVEMAKAAVEEEAAAKEKSNKMLSATIAKPSQRLKEAIVLRNLKQSEVAKKVGIKRSTLSAYLYGRYEPTNNVSLLAEALNVSEEWLMGCDVPMERENAKEVEEDVRTCDESFE